MKICIKVFHSLKHVFIHIFAKAFDKVSHRRLLYKLDYWDKSVHPQVDQLMALCAHSTSSFEWSSLRSSPSVIQCTSGVGFKTHPVPYLYISSGLLFADDYSILDCLTLQEDLTSLGKWEANWQMKFNVAKCHSM